MYKKDKNEFNPKDFENEVENLIKDDKTVSVSADSHAGDKKLQSTIYSKIKNRFINIINKIKCIRKNNSNKCKCRCAYIGAKLAYKMKNKLKSKYLLMEIVLTAVTLGLLTMLGYSIYMHFKQDTELEDILAYTATSVIGIFGAYQAHIYRKTSDEHNEQDLLLRANPTVYFEKIENFRYVNNICEMFTKYPFNYLSYEDPDPTQDFTLFKERISFDLIFKTPSSNSVIDSIKINALDFACKKSESLPDEINKVFSYRFINRSNCNSIMINRISENTVSCNVTLYLNKIEFTIPLKINDQMIFEYMINSDYIFTIDMQYILSNTFNVSTLYETQISMSPKNYQMYEQNAAAITHQIKRLHNICRLPVHIRNDRREEFVVTKNDRKSN